MLFLLVLVLAALLGASSPARAAKDKITQVWPELDVYYGLDANTRLYFLLAPIREVDNGEVSDVSDPEIGANIEFGLLPIARAQTDHVRYDNHRMTYLRFRAGIRYLAVTGDDDRSEWRAISELTPRGTLLYDIHLAFRNRFDLRWINDEYSWRYRPRLWLEREFKMGAQMALVPYGSAEIFWDSRRDTWNRTLYQVGAAFSVTPWFAPEAYWAHQIDDAADGETVLDALGLVLTFYF